MKLKQRMATSAATALKYCVAALAATAMVVAVIPNVGSANTPLPHAAFTTTNPTSADGPGHCQNGNEAVNCNIYDGKDFVWLNGGPVQAQLDNGDYFFAVLVPGGQGGNENPNDCTPKNLSDFTPCDTSNTGAGDTWENRMFSIQDHVITYSGTHDFGQGTNPIDQNKIRLMPYDDTTNNGGVYILAICSLADANPETHDGLEPGVDPSDCKYDAFKVNGGGTVPDAQPLEITKDATGTYNTSYTWGIDKSVNKTLVEQVGGTATFTYTVHVTHNGGSVGDVKVQGKIQVFNPNVDDQNNTVPVDIDSVTDHLSDNTDCTVTDGGAQTLTQFETDFAYECDLSALPQSVLDNVATVTWSSQELNNGAFLVGSDASFTFKSVNFAETLVDNCTTVTDPVPTGGTSGDNPFPKKVCVGDARDGGAGTDPSDGFTFLYHTTYSVPTNDCKEFTNTATESTDGNQASVTVKVCGPAKTGALTIGFWKTTNGQGSIGTYCQAANGTTALGTYLATLGTEDQGPFKDAGAVTTCAALKTYVYNILNGATATDMNKMLKAQMLGTALDVWFSGPGWSSTKIGSVKPPSNFLQHNNLGTFNMDTTAVCPMVDNLNTGSATCKLGLPSTDAVTAGAVPTSPMSMQAILDFAASWTTGGGAFIANSSPNAWYGTPSTGANRTKQEILKNIFDQFNNQQAFGSF
jgi:hypothetical protein